MSETRRTRREYHPRPERKQRQFRKRLRAYRAAHARPRQFPRAAVPSFFTLMNLFSGFLALTQVYEGNFTQACWLIVLAGFFDALDGMMARLTNGQSLFGVELDSLADVVSFGVAPSYLVYVFGLREFGMLGLIVSSLPAICGAVRLARFNVHFDGEKKDYFEGLPIPGQAIAIVALILNFQDFEWLSRTDPGDLSVLIPTVFVLAGLMVSSIRFEAIPKPSAHYIRQHPRKSAATLVAMLLTIFWIPKGLLLSLAVYLLFGIVRALVSIVQQVMNTPVDAEEVTEEADAPA